MIGDAAIRFRARYPNEFNYWDLGAEWKRTTGLPFVFALWLIRPEVAGSEEIAMRLRALRDLNRNSLDRVIADQIDFSPDFCRFYFQECLRFSFGESEKEGLLRFRTLCEKHEILEVNPTPLRLV
jgi:predicted solute-binding protein